MFDFVMAPSSQTLESPQFPGLFTTTGNPTKRLPAPEFWVKLGVGCALTKRVLKETRQAKEEGDKQVRELVSVNATLEERIKEQAKALADSTNAAQVKTIMAERDALAVENQELKVWVAELQAQLQGKLVVRRIS
ncbi:MAG: hypothetical protein K2Y10_11575 [Burkholderiaceae bacterium]|nr:hypothetical protein [Burkholderiaceae bacterium]